MKLPARFHRFAQTLAHRLGRRGAALLWIGFLDLVIGWSLVDPVSRPLVRHAPIYHAAFQLAAPSVWAALWAAAGLVCLVQAPMRLDRVGFACAIAVKLTWALLITVSWLADGAVRGWLSAVVWYTFAAFIGVIAGWPEQEATQP